jgi:hypothetical protein
MKPPKSARASDLLMKTPFGIDVCIFHFYTSISSFVYFNGVLLRLPMIGDRYVWFFPIRMDVLRSSDG